MPITHRAGTGRFCRATLSATVPCCSASIDYRHAVRRVNSKAIKGQERSEFIEIATLPVAFDCICPRHSHALGLRGALHLPPCSMTILLQLHIGSGDGDAVPGRRRYRQLAHRVAAVFAFDSERPCHIRVVGFAFAGACANNGSRFHEAHSSAHTRRSPLCHSQNPLSDP